MSFIDCSFLYPVVTDLTEYEYGGKDTQNALSENNNNNNSGHHQPSDSVLSFWSDCLPSTDILEGMLMSDWGQDTPPSPRGVDCNIISCHEYDQNSKMLQQEEIPDAGHEVAQNPANGTFLVQEQLSNAPTFEGRYVLIKQINKGRSSTIWECLDRVSGLRYVVKIIDRRNLTAEKDQSVYTEARVLSHLNQKTETIDEGRGDLGRPSDTGILRLVNFFDDTTHFYIVTNYMVSGDLFTNITTKRCYTEDEAQLLAVKLLEAVQYMHRKGVVHRDLTADNIFLSESLSKTDPNLLQHIAIANFRLASLRNSEEENRKKRTKGHRRAGSRVSFEISRPKLNGMCGTPSYVAPEVLQGVPYDSQVDMWSIGVILYYAIAGYMPFEAKAKKPLYKRITEGDYGFHGQKWTHVSRGAKQFISKLLKVDPTIRCTVHQALNHPWIEEVRIQDDLPDPSKGTATKDNASNDISTHHSKAHKRMGSLQSLKGVLRKMGTKKNVKGSDGSCQKDAQNRDDDETYYVVSGGTSKWHGNGNESDLPRTIAI